MPPQSTSLVAIGILAHQSHGGEKPAVFGGGHNQSRVAAIWSVLFRIAAIAANLCFMNSVTTATSGTDFVRQTERSDRLEEVGGQGKG
jgi:preprotein translocase subunit SecG